MQKLLKTIYYSAAALMPSILLFRLYNQNYAHNYIQYTNVVMIAGILAIIGLLLFIFFKWITKTTEGALLTCGMTWVCFWLFGAVMGRVRIFIPAMTEPALMITMAAAITIAALLLRRFKTLFEYKEPPAPAAKPIITEANTAAGLIDPLAEES